MENKITPEVIEKARSVSSVEELLALAKENDIELTEEEAKEYFGQLRGDGELSDEELENVAGGGCNSEGYPVTLLTSVCKYFKCRDCGFTGMGRHCNGWLRTVCEDCSFLKKITFQYLCTNPKNKGRNKMY